MTTDIESRIIDATKQLTSLLLSACSNMEMHKVTHNINNTVAEALYIVRHPVPFGESPYLVNNNTAGLDAVSKVA